MKQLALVMVALLLIVGVVTAGDLLPEETMTIIEKPTVSIKETPTVTETIAIAPTPEVTPEPAPDMKLVRPISERNPFVAVYQFVRKVNTSEVVDEAPIIVSCDGLQFNFTKYPKLVQVDAYAPERVLTEYTSESAVGHMGLNGLSVINMRFRLDDGRTLIIRRGVV